MNANPEPPLYERMSAQLGELISRLSQLDQKSNVIAAEMSSAVQVLLKIAQATSGTEQQLGSLVSHLATVDARQSELIEVLKRSRVHGELGYPLQAARVDIAKQIGISPRGVCIRIGFLTPFPSVFFREVVLPHIEALTRINEVLSYLINPNAEPKLVVERISFSSPLDISLGGFIPETLEAIRQLVKDRGFRNEHEKKMAELEEAEKRLALGHEQSMSKFEETQRGIEIRKNELELVGMRLEQAKKLIDLVAPAELSPAQRLAIVVKVFPDIQLLTSNTTAVDITAEEEATGTW
ncbi:MAG: hypothetical protein FJ009_19815 [Chloroflexi bacterium]|nr:hypothetical protein [Chloroflexota bacterium]